MTGRKEPVFEKSKGKLTSRIICQFGLDWPLAATEISLILQR